MISLEIGIQYFSLAVPALEVSQVSLALALLTWEIIFKLLLIFNFLLKY